MTKSVNMTESEADLLLDTLAMTSYTVERLFTQDNSPPHIKQEAKHKYDLMQSVMVNIRLAFGKGEEL